MLVPTSGACVANALGSGSVTLSGSTFSVNGYGSSNCSGSVASAFTSVSLNVCTAKTGGGPPYILLQPSVKITGIFRGATCTGFNYGTVSVNPVGTEAKPACTNGATSGSLKASVSSDGATFSLSIYTAAGCSGNAMATWTTTGDADACTTDSDFAVQTGGRGQALISVPSPSASPSAVASPSAAPSAAATPQKVALLGVYADAACTSLYPTTYKLDAIGTVGGCSTLEGLGGSGLISQSAGSSAGAQTFDVDGYSDTTACENSPLASWRNGARARPRGPHLAHLAHRHLTPPSHPSTPLRAVPPPQCPWACAPFQRLCPWKTST